MLSKSQPDASGGILGPNSEWITQAFDGSQADALGGIVGPISEWTIETFDVV
jgi:hypothetical protein